MMIHKRKRTKLGWGRGCFCGQIQLFSDSRNRRLDLLLSWDRVLLLQLQGDRVLLMKDSILSAPNPKNATSNNSFSTNSLPNPQQLQTSYSQFQKIALNFRKYLPTQKLQISSSNRASLYHSSSYYFNSFSSPKALFFFEFLSLFPSLLSYDSLLISQLPLPKFKNQRKDPYVVKS